ncbi:hypothetical protein O181_132644 [Austropuccinia psidii MF-1]|uniref:Uncharacterized protein n=1 Tax=Austropuccinia psidii MF-1 TaxID=1389203 RepID=A0A9Q3L7M3_9BASI|nr:hypothetical protein [Austropuccinia psidii MF-1]
MKKDEPREPFKTNTPKTNEQRKLHKCVGIGQLANNFPKKENINEIVETEDHNDKEEESESENDTKESNTSESDKINIINARINNISFVVPICGEFEFKSLTDIQDSKLHRTKPAKEMGYAAGKSSISIVMVEDKQEKVNLDTGAYCTCVYKG